MPDPISPFSTTHADRGVFTAADGNGGGGPSRFGALGHAAGAAWALLAGIGLLMLGTGLQGSLLGLRASIEDFGTSTTGVIMSSYYVGYLIGSTQTPRLVAAVGHIRVFAAFASIASSAVLLHAIVLEPAWWMVFRIASGFCIAGLFVVAESWLNDIATNETRGSLLSMYMVIVGGGMGAGQLLLNAAPPESFELFVVTSVLVSLALVPTALSVRANPRLLQPSKVTLREVFTAAPLGVIGVILAGSATGGLLGMGVVYARLVGLSFGETSAFMLVAILGGAVLQAPIGAMSDRTDRRRVIMAAALCGTAISVYGATGPSGALLLVTVGLAGGFTMPLYALLNAHTNDWIDPEQIVGAGSRLVMASGIGAITGPFLASMAMDAFGAGGFFWFLAVVQVLVAAYAAWRLTRRVQPVEEQSHFAAIPSRGASVLVATLNPDAWDEEDHPKFPTEEIEIVNS